MKTLAYVIDTDERGEFKAHVLDKDGNIIIEIQSNAKGEIGLIIDGYMKHTKDIQGLTSFLRLTHRIDNNTVVERIGEVFEKGLWD